MGHNEYDTNDYPELVEGIWVHAQTVDGHAITGYIERLDQLDKTALIVVCHACCDRVGNVAWAPMSDIDLLGQTKLIDTEGYILNMIDFALDTRDKRTFKEYTTALRKLKESPNYANVYIAVRLSI